MQIVSSGLSTDRLVSNFLKSILPKIILLKLVYSTHGYCSNKICEVFGLQLIFGDATTSSFPIQSRSSIG